MSKPSIEALRQAFLDPLSRIQLQGNRPSDALVHPRITKVVVRGAKFVEDQEVCFSEGLNCVIGGRGSGKSSLLEYVRFAVGLEEPTTKGDEEDPALQRKRKQLKDPLTATSRTAGQLRSWQRGFGYSASMHPGNRLANNVGWMGVRLQT